MKKYFKLTCLIFIIPILTGVISGVITAKIENINFISALGIVLEKIFAFILNILTFKISIWVIAIVVFIIIVAIKILLYIEDNNNKKNIELKKEKLKSAFRNYTEDEYEGLKYKWEWKERSNGIEMINLHPVCECGCIFNYSPFDNYLKCPDCKKTYRNNVDLDSAMRVFANRYSKRLEKLKNENR